MRAYDLIMKTRRGEPLTGAEIRFLVSGCVSGDIPDYQLSAWLMAVCFQSLTPAETLELTLAMRDSGDRMDLSGIHGTTADKHSTGGVGDKTTLILAPVVAACGGYVPKMSGRGLGHTGGTIDKLESIPGFSTAIPYDRFIDTVNRAGCAVVAQSGHLVPADKKLYALRDLTATVDSIPLICASIMSKKLAMGADCILLDVKTGSGAFMKTEQEAVQLGEAMVRTAKLAGKRCRAVVTDMDMPLGSAVGNAIEVAEAISVLQGQRHTALGKLSLTLAAHMLTMCGRGTLEQCLASAEQAVDSGAALERFAWMLQCQGGDPAVAEHPERLPQPANSLTVTADRAGYLTRIASEEIGLAAMELGAGRRKAEDVLDPTAGLKLHCAVGDPVTPGMPLATLYATGVTDFSAAAARVRGAMPIGEAQPRVQPLLRQVIDTEGAAG